MGFGDILYAFLIVAFLFLSVIVGVSAALVAAALCLVCIPLTIITVFHGLEFLYKHRWRVLELTTASVLLIGWLSFRWYFYWDPCDVPNAGEMIRYAPTQVSFIYDANGTPMIELGNVFRKPVEYEDVPAVMEHATVAFEDKNFYEHGGVDWRVLPWRWIGGKGGGTITMQLVRNHYLSDWLEHERDGRLLVDNWLTRFAAEHKGTWWTNRVLRKLREMKYAIRIERQLRRHTGSQEAAKKMLLSRYLSTITYGYSMYGPDSASRFFFNEPLKRISPDEAALLASFAPAPSRYAVLADSVEIRALQKSRRDEVLKRMGQKHFLYDAQACGTSTTLGDRMVRMFTQELPRGDCRDDVAYYASRPISLIGRMPGGRTEAPASIQTSLDELEQSGFTNDKLFNGAIRIHTTIDLRIQRIVNAAARYGKDIFTSFYDAGDMPQVAVIVLANDTGRILGQFGGFNNDGRERNDWVLLDRTRKSWRQPGSAFKPFVYLSVFREDARYTPDSLVFDGGTFPVRMGGGSWHMVHNYDYLAKGWMPFWQAFAESRNVPAMHVAMEYTTLDHVLETAHLCGIKTRLRREPSTILGANDVTVTELTNAMRTITSGGLVAEPHAISYITDSFGNVVWKNPETSSRLNVSVTAIVYTQALMRGVVRLPSGTAHSLDTSRFGIPLMAKTGTSNDFADARFVAGTYGPRGITVGVWIGHDDARRPLGEKATGGRLALPIAQYIFKELYGDQHILGAPPEMPEFMERWIDSYNEKVNPQKSSK